MVLAAGRRLGPYLIVGPVGAGGMGEVYRARDVRLDRIVAIKVLPAPFTSDPTYRARFEREARAVAALSHPNILSIFDFDTSSEIPYAVMEMLEGQTLRTKLAQGALHPRRVVDYGRQIAFGLAAAHDKGIVHRDVKPENLFVTADGRVRILDFGLARMAGAAARASARGDPDEPVSESELTTEPGTVLGTVAYMSPEQVRGELVDHRSDIFSFGGVLYEMLSGQRPFVRPNPAETMSAILKDDPPPQPAAGLAPALDRIVRHCLEKSPAERFHSAHDIAFALGSLSGAEAGAAGPEGVARGAKRRWATVLAALAGLAAGALLRSALSPAVPTPEGRELRFTLPLAEGLTLEKYASASIAVSASGDRLAYVAKRGGMPDVYVRTLGSGLTQELPGTEGASNPFFSPDGEWIAFESGGRLRKVAVAGGRSQTIAAAPYFCGGTWGGDEAIVYAPTFTSGLWRVSASGGTPERLTTLDRAKGEAGHLWPDRAPRGGDLIFTIWTGGALDEARLAILSPGSDRPTVLLENAYSGRFVGTHTILFSRGGSLFVTGYDPTRRRAVGTPVAIRGGVASDASTGASLFAASATLLVYVPGAVGAPVRSLVWVDRSGRTTPATRLQRGYIAVRASPGGERLAVSLDDTPIALWTWIPRPEGLTRISFSGDDHSVVWSPDGRRVAFESGRGGTHQIFVRPADGTGEDDRVTEGDREDYLSDWSPDGRRVAFTRFNAETGADVLGVDLDGNRTPRPLAASRFWERGAAFSPDGRHLAYVSDESGQDEVYVRTLAGEGKIRVSVDGGTEPAWARSGDELYFRGKGGVMAARWGPGLASDAPAVLFPDRYFQNKFQSRTYDVARDGRFLMISDSDPSPARELQVAANWLRRPRPE